MPKLLHNPKADVTIPEQGTMECAPVPIQKPASDHREALRRFASWASITVALAQVAALGIVAAFTGAGHLPTILQYHTPTVNVAAWRAPMSGAAGATIVGLELLSIVAGIALCTRRGRIRHVGHAILTAWITFWLYRLLSLAVAVGEVELWGLVALCSVAAGCQLVAWKLSPKPVAG